MNEQVSAPEEALPIILPVAGFVPPPMPPEIAKAVCAVMKAVRSIRKDQENTQGNYKYVSVDQFYEEVRASMADAGIFTMTLEDSIIIKSKEAVDRFGNKKTSNWLTGVYHIWLYHESGVSYGPVKREMTVVASGPQSYGSAPSFIEKYFLRGLFKIATGDLDVDSHLQDGLPSQRNEREDEQPPRNIAEERQISNSRKLDAAAYVVEAKAAMHAVKTTQEELRKWWDDERETMREYVSGKDDPLYKELREAFAAHGATLPSAPSDPLAVNGVIIAPAAMDQRQFEVLSGQFSDTLHMCSDAASVEAAYHSLLPRSKLNEGQAAHLEELRDARIKKVGK